MQSQSRIIAPCGCTIVSYKVYGTVRILIVANAPGAVDSRLGALATQAHYIIAADGGARPLAQAGIMPHLLIGDLDSVPKAQLDAFVHAGVNVSRFPREKDETDLELALQAAVSLGATHIDLCGVLGGRWDHTFATIAMVCQPMLAHCHIRMYADDQTLCIVRKELTLTANIGDTVSLLPLTPTVDGITTYGLAYPLQQATLYFEHSRGVSNVVTENPTQIFVTNGILLVIHHLHPVL